MVKFIFDTGNLVKHNYLSFQIDAAIAIYTMCKLMVDSVPFQDKNPIVCNMADELFSLFQTDCDYSINIRDFELDLISNEVEVTFDDIIEALERRSGITDYLYHYIDCELKDNDAKNKIKIFENINKMQNEFNQLDYTFSAFGGGIKYMNIKSKINTIIDDDRKLKAYATVSLDNQFVINGVKVLENKNGGVFVSMPQIKNLEGKYQDICYPKNSDLRNSIAESVIGEYNAELQLRNENIQSDEIEEQNDSFEPSM